MNLPRRLQQWEALTLKVGAELHLDPALLLAIMDRESQGGESLDPPGPGGVGDKGNGLGLMQLDRRYAGRALLPGDAWKDPETNIRAGARELRKNLDRLHGDVAAAVAAFNVSLDHILRAQAQMKPDATLEERVHAFDAFTMGCDYVADVLERREAFSRPDNDPDFGDIVMGRSAATG